MFDKLASIVGVSRGELRLACALLALAFLANAAPGEPPAKDVQGDPLPEGAVARLGTTRWRHEAVVAFAAFLHDGEQVVCVTDHGAIGVWEFPSGKEIRRFSASAKANKLNLAALSADGKTIASNFYVLEEGDPRGPRGGVAARAQTSEKEIHLHDLATGKELTSLKVEDGTLKELTFSPKGEQLTTRHDDVVRTWDWANAKELAKFTSPVALPSAPVTSGPGGRGGPGFGFSPGSPVTTKGLLAYSPDGKSLAFYGLSQVPRFVEASTGKEISAGPGHTEPIVSIWFTPDGKQLFTNSQHTVTNKPPGCVHTWDVSTWKDLGPVQPSSTSGGRMIVSSDGRVALDWPDMRSLRRGGPGGGAPGAVEAKLIDLTNGKELAKLEFTDGVGLPVFSPDSKTVAVTSADETKIDLYDATKAKLLRTIDIPGEEDDVNPRGLRAMSLSLGSTLQFSADGKVLAFQTSVEATTINVFDVATGKDIAALPLAQEPIPEPPPGAPVGGRGRIVRATPLRGDFSPDGRCFALVNGEQVALYELSTGKCRQTYGKKSESSAVVRTAVATVAMSPSGKLLAYGGKDGVVHLWNMITGKELAAFKGHTAAVTAVAFAPNGKTLASASADTTALLWDIEKLNPRGESANAPPKDDLEQWWQILAGDDAAKAAVAMADLTAAPKEAVTLIKEQVKPAVPLDTKQIEKWLAELNDEEFDTRTRATSALRKIDERLLPFIEKALDANPSPESRQRLEDLRGRLTSRVRQGERLRVLRAIEVLERIGTPQASELLRSVADWAPGAPLAAQARAALERLERLEK